MVGLKKDVKYLMLVFLITTPHHRTTVSLKFYTLSLSFLPQNENTSERILRDRKFFWLIEIKGMQNEFHK